LGNINELNRLRVQDPSGLRSAEKLQGSIIIYLPPKAINFDAT